MKRRIILNRILSGACVSLLLTATPTPAQNTLRQIEEQGVARTNERQAMQQRIEALDAVNRELVDDYRSELRTVQGLETYVGMLGRQIDGQVVEIDTLQTSIADVAVIERQVLPMLARMVESLEKFVDLDLPFLLNERNQRVERLGTLLERADVTVAEKVRSVFEAYQIETDFGSTVEAYKGKLSLADGEFDADFLRIGRVALLYRTLGEAQFGYWNTREGAWHDLPATPYRRLIEKGLRVARQEIAPELISIPLNPSKVATR